MLASEGPRSFARAAIVLLGAALVVYFPLLVPGRAPYSSFSDVVTFHVGLKDVLFRGLASGELPLWRYDQMLGGPALTQPQALYLHPLQLLFWVLEPAAAFGPTFFLSFYVGALGAFAFARRLGASQPAAVLAGIAQLVCFKLIIAGFAGWSSPIATLVMLPWIGHAIATCALAPGLGAFVTATCTFGVTFAGGSPQTLYYALLVLGALPFALVGASRENIARLARSYVCLGAALLLGLGCNAYLWLPLALDLPLLARATQDYTFFLSGHGLDLSQLATWLAPELFGTPLDRSYAPVELWEDVAYFGLVPWLFAAHTFMRLGRASTTTRYLALAFVLSALASLESPLLEGLHAHMPGYAVFRLPGRMLFVTAVVGIALFALGVDALLARLRARPARVTHAAIAGLAVLMLGEGAFYAHRYLTTAPSSQLVADRDHPARELGASDGTRVAALGRASLTYGWASSLGIELVNGYDPYVFSHVRDYLALVTRGTLEPRITTNWLDTPTVARVDLLQALGVGYVLSAKPRVEPWLRPVSSTEAVRRFRFYRGMTQTPLHVYALSSSEGRARFATRTLLLPSMPRVEQWLEQNPLQGAGVLLDAARALAKDADLGAPDPSDHVEVLSRTSSTIRVGVHAARKRLVVLAEAFHPGWQARVGSTPAPVLQTNLALLGVFVPPGDSEVELEFRPRGFATGVRISALAWLLLGIAAVAAGRVARASARGQG